MRNEARALGQALLDHHAARIKATPPGTRIIVTKYTLRYSDLCSRAGIPHLTRICGPFLQEVARWCFEQGMPPLHALAVNETGLPGQGYESDAFKTRDWPVQVEQCIRFVYPAKMP